MQIYTSPFLRCLQTALAVAEALGIADRIIIDNDLCEVMSPLVIKHAGLDGPQLPSMEQIEQEFPGIVNHWTRLQGIQIVEIFKSLT